MFTGIIEHTGKVIHFENGVLRVLAPGLKTRVADSVATSGVCLTLRDLRKTPKGPELIFDLGPETLRRSSLGNLRPGSTVNLEKSLTLSKPIGGHFVTGHVDEVGRVRDIRREKNSWFLTIGCGAKTLRYIAAKGSVAMEGVSLTVVDLVKGGFRVMIIPFTHDHTSFRDLRKGSPVNLEIDILARYVARIFEKKGNQANELLFRS